MEAGDCVLCSGWRPEHSTTKVCVGVGGTRDLADVYLDYAAKVAKSWNLYLLRSTNVLFRCTLNLLNTIKTLY